MAFARTWRHASAAEGPARVMEADIPALNTVFSEAFTDRYRRDGLIGVRVPHLNPAVWRFAIADAEGGAMCWRNSRGSIIAFNIAHRSGVEGWMGPLAVHPDHQGHGIGKSVVLAGVEWLKERGARVIGLETMPRTMDNVGFYSALGFTPGRLTVTLTLEGVRGRQHAILYSALDDTAKSEILEKSADLTDAFAAGYDYRREISLTGAHGLGETLVLESGGQIRAFAICHSVPLVQGRIREEVRVLKLVARTAADADELITQLCIYTRNTTAKRMAVRVQSEYDEVYRGLIQRGARVRWTDLRMSLSGFGEGTPESGIVLSNWEI
ncbi:MAG: GNAT family N-acetyltransferase [Gemmatimonadaceae bacterium]|nr:GNAT family N-acetyltransferase [Gemmatimonadaceae bacterium]